MSFLRRTTIALALLGALGLLAGCLKANQTVKMEKDGRGKSTLVYTIDLAKMKQLQEMRQGMAGGGGEEEGGGGMSDPVKDMSPDKYKKLLEGNSKVRLVSSKTEEDKENQKLKYTLEIEFDSLKDFYGSGLVSGTSVKLEKQADGSYKFTSTMEAMGGGGAEGAEGEDAAAAAQQAEAFMTMLKPMVGDFEMNTTVVLPTTIVETNGTKAGDNEVSWKMVFEDFLKKDKRTQTVTFAGEGVTWEPFAFTAAELSKLRAEAEGKGEGEKEEGDEAGEGDEGKEEGSK